MNHPACHIIVAAGSGSRFGADLPKQFCLMDGRPVLMETIRRMRSFAAPGSRVLLVISPDMRSLWHDLCERHSFESPEIVDGGSTRWHSVSNALAHPFALEADIITVHDGARPVISEGLISRVTDIRRHGNIPVVPLTDSIRAIEPDGGSHSADRSLFRAVQTPQAFRADLLRRAYMLPWRPEFTDDASVMEAAGFGELDLVDGDPDNIKITHPGDIEIASLHLRRQQ